MSHDYVVPATAVTSSAPRTEPRWATGADVLALVLLLLSAWAMLAGGIRFELGPLVVSALSWKRLAFQAALVLVLRHGLTRVLEPSAARRRGLVLAYGFFLLTLALGSPQRRIGDGHEYLAMALNMSALRPPALSDAELRGMERTLDSFGDSFAGTPLANPGLRGSDGRQDFLHFWFYPALAAPWVWVARTVALPPNACFAFVNILLLVLGLWVVSGHVRRDVALLLFAGPIIWWADKGHTEAFTFALLAIAMSLVRTAPWWSLVALGAAGAQNPTISLALPVVGLVAAITRPEGWRDLRLWRGAIAGSALALLHPLYYFVRLGRLSPLLDVTMREAPSFALLSAPLIDTNVGILVNFPWLTLALVCAVLALAWRSPSQLREPTVLLSVSLTALFLVAFSQIPNVSHGGSPGISRYGLWIVPMTLPVLAQCDGIGRRPRLRWLALLTLVSCLWSIWFFHPAIHADRPLPTALADALWTRYPWADNPLPEVFAERVIGRGDANWLPVATGSCEKVLLLGTGADDLLWPVPCVPATAQQSCLRVGALCYANQGPGGYAFVEAPRQPGYEPRLGQTWAWTRRLAGTLRQSLKDVDWNGLRIARFTDPVPMVRRFERVEWVYMLQSDRQFLVYVSRPAAGATLRIETAAPMRGRIVDPATGETLQAVTSGETLFMDIAVPGPRREAVLFLTRADSAP